MDRATKQQLYMMLDRWAAWRRAAGKLPSPMFSRSRLAGAPCSRPPPGSLSTDPLVLAVEATLNLMGPAAGPIRMKWLSPVSLSGADMAQLMGLTQEAWWKRLSRSLGTMQRILLTEGQEQSTKSI